MTDIETLRTLGPITDGDFVRGTFAVRIDFHCPAPLHKRPAQIDPFLERAAQIMGPALQHYGGESGFASSKGRKVRASDIVQLGEVSSAMRTKFEEDVIEKAETRKSIEAATGQKTYGHNFIPIDSGNFFLGDRLPVEQSETHIILNGNGSWGVSLSFGLDVFAQNQNNICQLAQDIFNSGIALSGNFGYAVNVANQLPDDIAKRLYLPPTRRFQMLNPVVPAGIRFLPKAEMGVAPVGCWYCLEDDWAVENGLDPAKITNVAENVFSITKTANGHLVKLWEYPILGDAHDTPDMTPAIALSKFLGPALENAYRKDFDDKKHTHNLNAIPVGTLADRWSFYTRFVNMVGRV